MSWNSLPTSKICPRPTEAAISISAPINACQANDQACLIPTISDGAAAGSITNLNNVKPVAPIFSAARTYIVGMLLIPLNVDNITEKIELMITTKKIPKSFNPINRMANGTHAILGNDCNPKAKELIVLPKPRNLIISNPTPTPRIMEIEKLMISRHIVVPMLVNKITLVIKSAKDRATIAGDGNDTLGNISRTKTSCHMPINIDTDNTV